MNSFCKLSHFSFINYFYLFLNFQMSFLFWNILCYSTSMLVLFSIALVTHHFGNGFSYLISHALKVFLLIFAVFLTYFQTVFFPSFVYWWFCFVFLSFLIFWYSVSFFLFTDIVSTFFISATFSLCSGMVQYLCEVFTILLKSF